MSAEQSERPGRAGRLVLFLVLALAVSLFFLFDLDRLLSLQGLQAGRARIEALQAAHPLALAGGFFLVYVAVTAVSLPGAAVMSLAAGAVFGLLEGAVLVSFASSLGATLAFLAARYLLRDWVHQRFGRQLRPVDEGVARDGPFYLFTLRLVPVVPFFLVNLLMGMTPMRVTTFYWVSQLGMLPATLVYVNAGTRLGQLESPGDVLSPALLLSFAALGLFPWLARAVLRGLQRRRRYRPWRRPRRFDYNLVVIGGGAAGLVSAYVASAARARVALVEAGRMGGDCLNTGCVPSKTLIAAARAARNMREAGVHGLRAQAPEVDFPALMARIQAVIRRIEPHDSAERYRGLGVDVLSGHARLSDPWTVEVDTEQGPRRLRTRAVVIATGARPRVPPIPGLDQVRWLTSETLWDWCAGLQAPPASLLVLGGGPIGCELAQAFARLGSAVTLCESGPGLLAREDAEAAALVRAALEREGVRVLTGRRALRCARQGNIQWMEVSGHAPEAPSGASAQRLQFEALLLAVGREARLEGYGLESLGISGGRFIDTDAYLQTLYPNILAAGDVAGPQQLTHAAAHQAWYAAVNGLFGDLWRMRPDQRVLPRTTFTSPEVAAVGLTEQAARDSGQRVEVTRYALSDLDRAIAEGATGGFVKVLTAPGRDRILGVTIVGEHAGELLAEFVLAMRHGLGLGRILATVHAYPTFSEAARNAAGQWRRAHLSGRLLGLLQRYHDWRRG